jgi:hypothetical protein
MEQLLLSLGAGVGFGTFDAIAQLQKNTWNIHFTIQKIPNLFNKIELKKAGQ